jgi:hypothetical protein
VSAFGAAWLVAASNGEIVLSIIVVTLLGLAWVASLALLVFDSISVGAKVVWFLALTVLAPIAIPVYVVWRRSRRSAVAGDA